MNGVPWSHYETQLALRGDGSVPRVSYLEGAMELAVDEEADRALVDDGGEAEDDHVGPGSE